MHQIAQSTYDLFKTKEGSKHIATANCLRAIINYVRLKKSRNILELGIGIGTIAFSLKLAKEKKEIRHDFKYYGTEADQFCIDAFKTNIPGYERFVNHFTDLSKIPAGSKFDFIIIDGRDKSLDKIIELLAPGGVIFVEGGRNSQLDVIKKAAEEHGRKYLEWNGIRFSLGHLGGYTVRFFDPTISDYIMYFKGKTATFIKWRLIKLIKIFFG